MIAHVLVAVEDTKDMLCSIAVGSKDGNALSNFPSDNELKT
jgi:hypothetical protein